MGKPAQLTRGFAQVPNGFIENLSLLVPAEVAMALLLFRYGGNTFSAGGVEVTVSDEHWEKWTGFKPRMKDAALAGLKAKCITVEGRGDKARIFWEPDRWRQYVKEQAELGKQAEIRTAGRSKAAAVKSKPGMMVHPDCKEKGCQNLCGEREKPSSCVIPSPVPINPPAAAPPPQRPAMKPAAAATRPIEPELVSSPGRSRNASVWSETTAAVTSLFNTADREFILKLVARARVADPRTTDESLAAAVRACWQQKKSVQKTEGLFLRTVPAYLESSRQRSRDVVSIRPKHDCSECSDRGYIEVFTIDGDEPFMKKPCPSGCKAPKSLGSTA